MLAEEFEKLRNSIAEKLGDENMALISDDMSTLMIENTNLNNQISAKNNEISKLKKDKENLIMTNGNLIQKISAETKQEQQNYNDDKPKKHYSLKNIFDENGNFK